MEYTPKTFCYNKDGLLNKQKVTHNRYMEFLQEDTTTSQRRTTHWITVFTTNPINFKTKFNTMKHFNTDCLLLPMNGHLVLS